MADGLVAGHVSLELMGQPHNILNEIWSIVRKASSYLLKRERDREFKTIIVNHPTSSYKTNKKGTHRQGMCQQLQQ